MINEQNVSRITTVHLMGLQIDQRVRFLIFVLLLFIYCVIICGNFLLIILVCYSKTLHSPMYFFLSQLAVSDILLATDILPHTLHEILVKTTILSFNSCMAQYFFFVLAEAVEYFLLTVMSYDRYLAVCKPLHYSMIMNQHICWMMVSICWILGSLIILIYATFILSLQFCGPNVIDHFFCDLDPILQLSCSDTSIVQWEITLFGAFFLVTPFFGIVVSYIYIIFAILKIPSFTGKQKAFSTCSSHLSVVCTFFGTILCVYFVPSGKLSMDVTRFLPLLYTAGIPLMNPIIYSLRNKDLKQIIKNKMKSLHSK